MILRRSHRAQLSAEALAEFKLGVYGRIPAIEGEIREGRLLTLSLFTWEDSLFLYSEATDEALDLESLLPCGAAWRKLEHAFAFNHPVSLSQWRRQVPPTRRIGKLARLRPEKVDSYLFYHRLLEEEQSFRGEKYKYITRDGSLLFQYDEQPSPHEAPPHPPAPPSGLLPERWEDTRMDLHFVPWDAARPFFKEIEPLFSR